MNEQDPAGGDDYEPVQLAPESRWILGVGGLCSVIVGCVAIFTRDNEIGPAALVALGGAMLLIGTTGILPTRLKIGDHEAHWLSKKLSETKDRIDRAADALGAEHAKRGLTYDALLSGSAPAIGSPFGSDESRLRPSVEALERDVQFLASASGDDAIPATALLELGRTYTAQQEWSKAARALDQYVKLVDADWLVYFSLGVAHANRREGYSSDRAALRAYDQAMARLPIGEPNALVPRLYSYRAGVNKRLERLPQARADATVARQLAESLHDRKDAVYNLACIEAMEGNREAAFRELRELKELGGLHLVRGREKEYFSSLANDPEFEEIMES